MPLQSWWLCLVNIFGNPDARKETFNQMTKPVYSGSNVWEIFSNLNFIEIQKLKQGNCQIIKISNMGIKNCVKKGVNYKKYQFIRYVLCHTPDCSAGCYSYAKWKDWLSLLWSLLIFFFKSIVELCGDRNSLSKGKKCQEKRKDLIQYYLFLYGTLIFRP